MSVYEEIKQRLDRAETESKRLSRKILKIEKRLAMFNKHETEVHLSEQLKFAKSIKNKFALLYTKFTILESVRYYLADDPRLNVCLNNIIRSFDEDKRFWEKMDELTLEELAEYFYR